MTHATPTITRGQATCELSEVPVRFGALHLQHEALREELTAAFERVVAGNRFILGEEVERFEQEFAGYCGVGHCVGVSSGTAALTLMLRACEIGPGDEVIVPAHTFLASALAVVHAGAMPVLCDVDPATGLIDVEAAASVVGPRTAAILAVHLYGQACEMEALNALADAHHLLLLEDVAQAVGAEHAGRRTGSLGAAAGFSFYPGKNLGALGDGGAVCTDDPGLANRVRQLRNLGQRTKGDHVELGYNERLDGLQAAFLRVKLPHLDGYNAARRERAGWYAQRLAGLEVDLLHEDDATPCTYHVYPTRLADRDAVAASLEARGIETGIHYSRAVHQHPAWAGHSLRTGDVSVAEAWAAEELSLPMHPDLTEADVDRVADAVRNALDVHRR